MQNLIDRLNGIYRIPITDGLGSVGDQTNPNEFVRKFEPTPIQMEAAKKLSDCHDLIKEIIELIDPEEFRKNTKIHIKIKKVLDD